MNNLCILPLYENNEIIFYSILSAAAVVVVVTTTKKTWWLCVNWWLKIVSKHIATVDKWMNESINIWKKSSLI
mgnify:CR=1 FL=1